jgi:hypothetical protein
MVAKANTVKRVLVGAKNFGTALIPGLQIKRGDIVEVSADVAANLDVQTWTDAAGNDQPLFVETTDKQAKRYVAAEEPAPKKKAVKKKAATRRKKTT